MERTNRPFGRKDAILERFGKTLIMNTLEKSGVFDFKKHSTLRLKT